MSHASAQLPEQLTISHVAETWSVLIPLLENASSIEIDCASVAMVDCAGLQLLLGLKHYCEGSGKTLTLSADHQNVIGDKAQMLGIAALAH
ncbi:lipid asymmetry maintenance protein MlaB [Pokkaliibacter sp. CJK22405]|uniref:STAS domain-containing protein n=1 Tax=Pokkaliibacter sp. CJK22405 TaxID=3384615 RepID=UPI003984890A